jgi:rubredoxin
MTYVGIDYGHGQTNVDPKNGIRFGVIGQNAVLQAWADSSEPVYDPATCPKCGNNAEDFDSDQCQDGWEYSQGCTDYMCKSCMYVFDSSEAFGDEPNGYVYSGEGYEMCNCLDSDIMITKSPFYTHAQFCSPCVPGAGNLDNPIEDGVKTYCVGHDWFEDNKAPYPVYKVESDELVPAETTPA